METESQPIHISNLFGNRQFSFQKTDREKRGELITEFARRLGKPEGYVRFRLAKMMDLQTLYFIKSDCDQAAHRGIPWGAAFHTAIKSKV